MARSKRTTIKDLRKKIQSEKKEIEFIGQRFHIMETNLIDLEDALEKSRIHGAQFATEKLKAERKELEKQAPDLEKFERTNAALPESQRAEPPKNKYEEKLTKYKNLYLAGLMAIALFEDSKGETLSSMIEGEEDISWVLEQFASHPEAFIFVTQYLSSWSSPLKNG